MQRHKVLIVEDHADTAAMLQKTAELAGHEAAVCQTGFQALELAPQFGPDVVLLDIGLPDMDGWQLARSFRENALMSDPRIIAVSAYRTNADKARSTSAGIDLHLDKPVQRFELLMALDRPARQSEHS